ncbi:MaoC family dehydratase N-terminal domain-containing protein [Viridibacillus sp. YIM B01967]|uniref:MaoC family dehydratase N-terminal domain-containing protein n=1 Tax=Viridibacillus soli TaxID=2798301 RepID=A0ABS1H799_9BACL|nr:MaoC family dehydratase N-terminal domain-containing protein [Viridibacillus soli]MBK3495186.1 MaoC family dehydratase N-terminal domain-containing protein [Viridibacillus soli]
MHFKTGMVSDSFTVKVDRQDIQNFARSIKNRNQLHYDLETAKKAGFPDIIAPPTLPILFWQNAKLDWLEQVEAPLIHGEQKFTYIKRIVAGDIYKCRIFLKDVMKKQGSTSVIWILKHVLEGYQNERLCFTSETTLILRELDENEVE